MTEPEGITRAILYLLANTQGASRKLVEALAIMEGLEHSADNRVAEMSQEEK